MRYDRPFDPYSDELWPVEAERWGLDILKPIIRVLYPADQVTGSIV